MLANARSTVGHAGRLDPEVHLKHEQLYQLIEFIAAELPLWRDCPERNAEISERRLTDQLCDHLNSAARKSTVWDILQFRTEIPDEVRKSRSIDLAPKPCGTTVVIEGRRHTQFDMLHRLPSRGMEIHRWDGVQKSESCSGFLGFGR